MDIKEIPFKICFSVIRTERAKRNGTLLFSCVLKNVIRKKDNAYIFGSVDNSQDILRYS